MAYATTTSGSNLAIPRLSLQPSTAAPTVEIAEGSVSSAAGTINFGKLASAATLRYEAQGAVNCLLTITNNGAFYSSGYYPTTFVLGASQMPPGNNTWTVTCTSAQGTQSIASVNGFIWRPISLNWFSNTTSTGGVFQQLANGEMVRWSESTNASFSQYYASLGADNCQIKSSGFVGSILRDLDNPNFNANQTAFSATLLWDSGPFYPPSFNFGSFQFGNPNTAAPPFGPYEGYKWLLICTNSDGTVNKTVMYGTSQP